MPIVFLTVLLTLAQAPAPGPLPSPPAAAPTDRSQEAFIIEQMISRIHFENDGTGRRETHARIKVQSDAGVNMWGQLVFGYNAATESLDIQHVRVRKADGTVVTAPAGAIQELTSPVQQQAPVYTDFRQKHVTVPSLRPGETLEYAVVSTVHTALAPGHFWVEHDFERGAIVLDEQLELDIPASRTVILKTAADVEPRITDAAGRRTYRWTSAQLVRPKEKTEEELQAEAEEEAEHPRRAAVRLTTFQDWDAVGRWYLALEKGPRSVTPEIRQKAAQLTKGLGTDLQKLEALYDFVAPEFRYVSISLGMGRYQPRPAADVLRDQYGDCKDKHTLLASLMEAVGLEATTVLINSQIKMDPDFPSPSQFDHAITLARVGDQDIWLDVTTEVAPFRLLSANLRKKQALVVAPTGSRLFETPADPPVQSFTLQEVTGTLGELGTFTGTFKYTFRGDAELLLRSIFRAAPASTWKEVMEGIDKSAGVDGDVTDFKVSDPTATRDPFTIQYSVSKVGFVDWTKKSVALKLPSSGFGLPAVRATTTRPIDLGSQVRVEYRLDLALGPGYQARAPLPVEVSRDYGSYRATYTLEKSQFRAQRQLELRQGSLPAERANDFGSFRRTVTADNQQSLSLEIATVDSEAAPDLKAPELIRGGYDAIQNRSYAQAVTLLKRAVELAPKDTKGWNYLGDAYVALRNYDAAMSAYQKILEIDPYDEFVHNDLAYVHRTLGRNAEAEAAFRKQIGLNPLDKFAHSSLGELLVDMKKYGAAAEQLDRAIALSPQDGRLHVQLGTAHLQVGAGDRALAAFDKAIELAPNPQTWNNVAYQLALTGTHLDRALQYAESAVSTVSAMSRNFSVERVTARELGVVQSLASYWDTLGWVYFAKGELERAGSLVHASWLLTPSAEVGDHLARIYEKQGKTAEAIRMYGAAMNAERPNDEIRERLRALVGDDTEVQIAKGKPLLVEMRTFAVPAAKGLTGMADFMVLIGADARPEAVRFVSGNETLQSLGDAIRKVSFGPPLPSGAPAKVLRRGTLNCIASGCSIVLFPSHHAVPPE